MNEEMKDKSVMKYCSKCLAPSTRPRLAFNEGGVCNACIHTENKKQSIDWTARWKSLEEICDKHRSKDGSFDCLVPCSGGKDGSTVAWKIKHDLGMHPLCITFRPQLPTETGEKNLENFINSGFDHIMITPDPEKEKKFCKWGFIEQGQPKFSPVIGQSTTVTSMSVKLNIPFVMWGEEGESEYGGSSQMADKTHFSREERIKFYFEGNDPDEVADKAKLNPKEMVWWRFPSYEDVKRVGVISNFWSHVESWNPYENYLFAKKHCGYEALPTRSIGTYTNYAQLDDEMQDLHAYIMFIKFGFGRATSDACIDVRRGALDRKQALALVKRYDGEYPEALIPRFLSYFDMTQEEFNGVFDKLANRDVLNKVDGIWRLKNPPS
tara:strand:+ start:15767 stop:16906 length:1140 start_codon:yes stop_codon:yes gene_type:complete